MLPNPKNRGKHQLVGTTDDKKCSLQDVYTSPFPPASALGGEGPCQVILMGPKTKQALTELKT